jgi:hypothetical protein
LPALLERIPFAEWRPLPEAGTPDKKKKDQMIWHSIVGSAEGAYGYFLNSTSLESTLILKLNGKLIQCMNLSDRADANGESNDRAISGETEDNGDPDNFAWTIQQVDTIVATNLFVAENNGIPMRLTPDPYSAGFGYHSMHGAPSPWTKVRGKTCPGVVRREQFMDEVWPRTTAAWAARKDIENMTPQEIKAAVKEGVREVMAESLYVTKATDTTHHYVINELLKTGNYIDDKDTLDFYAGSLPVRNIGLTNDEIRDRYEMV